MRYRESVRIVALVLAAWFSGCSRSPGPAGPVDPMPDVPGAPGVLEVTVTVEGTQPDTDGYAVIVASTDVPEEPVAPGGGTVRFADLPAGSHSVRLEGLAPNCVVESANPRLFQLLPDQTFRVHFRVHCSGPGNLLIETISYGVEIDPDGYTVVLEASSVREEQIGANDSLLIPAEELAEAVWEVRLRQTAAHCLVETRVFPSRAVATFDPLKVRLLDDTVVRIQFTTACLPRSTRIAFQDSPSFPTDIYITPVSGGVPVNVTNHPATDMNPALSPNRRRIAFTSNRGGTDEFSFDLYAVDADGGGLSRLTNTPGFDLVGPQAWSPDGSRIAFTYSDGSGNDIYVMNADGTGVVRFTHEGTIECPPAWSPAGGWIAFCKDGGIHRMAPVPGSTTIKVVSEGFDPAWSPDGTRIAYSAGYVWDWPLADLAVVGVDGTGFVQLHPNLDNSEVALSPTWSPDGSWIAFAKSRGVGWDVVIVPFLSDRFGEVIRIASGVSPSWR